MSYALRVRFVLALSSVALPGFVFGQPYGAPTGRQPLGRYDLISAELADRPIGNEPLIPANAATTAGPGGPVAHGTWPTHAMHEPGPMTAAAPAPYGMESGIQPAAYPQSPTDFADDLAGRNPMQPAYDPRWENPRWQRAFGPQPAEQRVWDPTCDGGPVCDAPPPWIAPYETKFRTTAILGDGDDLGLIDVDLRHTLAFPRVPGLTLTPGTIVTFVDGPVRTDLPAQLYGHWIELQWHKQLSQRWAMQLAVAPGLYTDHHSTGSDSVRITGRALAFWGMSQRTQIVFGVVYLDREDVAALPAAGVIHQPNENLRYEILFPRPRVLYNVRRRSDGSEGWVYLAGEFGGGSWSVERIGGANDVVTYSDLRLIGGYEWKPADGAAWHVEGGWVFARSLEYESGVGDYDPSGTGMVRAGITF